MLRPYDHDRQPVPLPQNRRVGNLLQEIASLAFYFGDDSRHADKPGAWERAREQALSRDWRLV